MRTPTLRPLALASLVLTSGCLFDEAPSCSIGGDLCPSGFVCIDRACAVPGPAVDRGPVPDGRPDGAPTDGAPPDVQADAGPDRGPDARPVDARPVDMAPPDMRPICAEEVCNGLDDDCDGRVDEELALCANIPLDQCTWRHRAHHSYLFCNRPVPEAEAVDRCTRQYGLAMAVPDTCDESDWLWATGNLVPTPNDWESNARGRSWWLGMRLGEPDDGATIGRTDGADTALPDGGCWASGEPDDVLLGESCINLLYNTVTDDFGWNDETCGFNAGNPVNVLCEVPCDPELDADGDRENACVDCDDRDPDANNGDGIDRCALAPEAGFPPK